MTEAKLTPQGVNLTAMLAAYDQAQEGMPEQEKRAMNKKVSPVSNNFQLVKKKLKRKGLLFE